MFKELKAFLKDTDVNDKFDIEFIDIDKDNLSEYPKERRIVKSSQKLPITFISGKAVYSGKVDKMKTYLMLKILSR